MKTSPSVPNRRGGARRLPVVGVMGSGVRAHAELAAPLGRGLAEMGVHLLTGGGGGVMAAVSRAFAEVEDRAGVVLGVLPADGFQRTSGRGGRAGDAESGDAESEPAQWEPPPGYPNPWVEVAVRTHLDARGAAGDAASSRNHVNVLSSDVVVALPGGQGTASEVALALRYGRPLVLLGDVGRALGQAQGVASAHGPASPHFLRSAASKAWATESPADALALVRRTLGAERALDQD